MKEAIEDFGDRLTKQRITAQEAAGVIGLSSKRVRQLAADDKLYAYRAGTPRGLRVMTITTVAYLYERMEHLEREVRRNIVEVILLSCGLLKVRLPIKVSC